MENNSELLRQCWFLAGPTAGGKTATALALAVVLDAEIVSMDSMAVYRGMDIGTAKPTVEERSRVPHHLIDVVDPHEEFSVSDYVCQATRIAGDIAGRGRVPLFVGGTGLYLRSMLRGVFEGPDADWDLRRRLEHQARENGNDWLLEELRAIDAPTAARLHPNDVRRVIRAIEVYNVTGQPLSSQQDHEPLPKDEQPAAVFWLHPPRAWLHERVNRRVDIMMDQGLLAETRRLLAIDPPPGRTARQALGYRELIEHLEEGVRLDAAVTQIKTGTRQFAKRQHTWFRNLEECQSVLIAGTESPGALAKTLLRIASASGR
ncbi:MAG: tRNA (adenosine(37)-N6)-dimethylallyltransferase MiaA [Fuerstiella sp.]|nr:tRNA (adenosine(37)-N6)-dimethylallyltransferase MiaA [Fuerstiella sp.]MCP4511584.1 tRNA (adenosine(37)-N6)-dimethylallyltransferase MiaA [Fuerstiella sp.]